MIGKIVLGLWIIHFSSYFVNNVGASDDLRLVDESLDERNDVLIFKSIVQSISEWELKKLRRGHRSKREVSRVCYEDVGCFEDTGPFSYLEMLPSPPKDVGTRFFVYGSRKARSIPMEVPAESISDKAGNAIDRHLPTKVIVHGFGSSCDHVWVYEMRSALMAVIECNIVCVDWGPGSAVPNYVRAAANTRLVGRQLAKLIRSLDVPLDMVHLIGFSLGAHVAGFAGAELGNVSRITGLDPAGPLFEAQDPRARLDATDARFVDVIHSNGEQLILGGLGSWQPMGHVDFYPNGGRMQTGCSNLFLGAVSDIIWASPVEGRSLCNHRRAYKLFTDSISPKCRFPAFPCDGGYDALMKGECFPCGTHPDHPCGDMGFYSDKSPARGQLYLVTRDEEPFCAYQYQVKVYNSRHERPVKSYGKLQVTLLAEGSINETFTMTKKDDEELLVGATLQKIVVPHPALSSLDAIEIKYTAYSGWISSGLVSWAVDKISVLDSYGTVYSVCKRGLILESGRPVYLPLYPGDCSVPPEQPDNVTSSDEDERQQQQSAVKVEIKSKAGIGPFTREQNYERSSGGKDSFANEVPQKGLGPFTKEQNIKIAIEQAKLAAKDYADNSSNGKNYQTGSSPWSLADLSGDGASNSVDNSIGELQAERGRGFSSSSLSHPARPLNLDRSNVLPVLEVTSDPVTSASTSISTTSEIHEPVLRLGNKKPETGRSLKLPEPEITEPVLRPRGTRQDSSGTITTQVQRSMSDKQDRRTMEDRKHEMLEESPSSRGFTVQFLPERLAGILAQAERYARQTLLPLISQYTPSFIGGARSDRPKYFPPLGNLFGVRDNDDDRVSDSSDGQRTRKSNDGSNDSRTKYYFEFEEEEEQPKPSTTARIVAVKTSTETIVLKVDRNQQPRIISTSTSTSTSSSSSSSSNSSSSGSIISSSSSLVEVTTPKDEWVPMAVVPLRSQQTEVRKEKSIESEPVKGTWSNEGGASWTPRKSSSNDSELVVDTKIEDWVPLVTSNSTTSDKPVESTSTRSERDEAERKFIPLVDLAEDERGDNEGKAATQPRSIVFPYVYERKNDPRTRYIPLIPEEDLMGGLGILGKEHER